MKEYFTNFFTDESGAELLEMAIAVVVTVGMIAAVVVLGSTIKNAIESATRTAQNSFSNVLGGGPLETPAGE